MSEEIVEPSGTSNNRNSNGNNNLLKYQTAWTANSLSWSSHGRNPFRLAVCSYIQDYKNFVDIIERTDENVLSCTVSWEHCYPPTKILFAPTNMDNDYIITTADYLRLWEITEVPTKNDKAGSSTKKGNSLKASVKRVFDSGKPNDFCSPVTSCDWNPYDVNTVGCCSIDTTVTIWDMETNQQKTKLVAHDKDVYDMAFASAETFSSCGADGSVRLFDLREMDHSTILYETPGLTPLLRLAYNQKDPHYVSVFGIESTNAVIIDVRYPSSPVATLSGRHTKPLNGMAWSPLSARNICTVGEDAIVCIWDTDPDASHSMYNFECDTPINNVVWRYPNQENWIGVTTADGVQILRY